MRHVSQTRVEMPEGNLEGVAFGTNECSNAASVLDQLIRSGAQKMLQAALEAEVEEFLARYEDRRDSKGRRFVVRNGHLPQRNILTGAGRLEVEQPRIRDRSDSKEPIRFTSKILPPYLRRSKAIDELIPWLYLKGVSTGDFTEALQALVGPRAATLSANVVVGLLGQWKVEFEAWQKRDLSAKHYVYLWVDGIYFNLRLGDERACVLVVIGATADGRKELVAVQDGYRESEQSWHELLVGLKQRGLKCDPKLAIGDGALGFWAAARKVFSTTKEQRCTVHKTANVLDKMPKSVQPRAKEDLHAIFYADHRQEADKALNAFVEKYQGKYFKATECLVKDQEELLAFFDFPAEHWGHLRTTNPIESTFATVRLRHGKTKGNGNRQACLAMVFKLVQSAERHWRKLNGNERILELLAGKKFVNGVMQETDAA